MEGYTGPIQASSRFSWDSEGLQRAGRLSEALARIIWGSIGNCWGRQQSGAAAQHMLCMQV